MKSTKYILAFGFLAVVLFVFILLPSRRSHNWYIDYNAESPEGNDPYNFGIFDELMARSLPNGYYTSEIDIPGRIAGGSIIPGFNSDDEDPDLSQNILAVQFNPWFNIVSEFVTSDGEYIDCSISAINDLDEYAQAGGKAMYVLGRGNFSANLEQYFEQIGYYFYEADTEFGSTPYSKEWWKTKWDYIDTYRFTLYDTIDLSVKYVPISMEYNNSVEYSIQSADPFFRIRVESTEDLSKLPRHEETLALRETHPTPAQVYLLIGGIQSIDDAEEIFALEVRYPKTGGRLVISTLGMYFCNLGIQLPNNAKIYELLLSRIDDKPITRLYSTKQSANMDQRAETGILSVLQANEALWLAWSLLIALIMIFVVSGCVRRKPVRKDIDDLDLTDYVAVREHKFRKSPLLHFLYQCSWMYHQKSDHVQLFDVNYRRVACIVDKYIGVQLSSANSDDLLHAANVLASRFNRDRDEILEQLSFMREWHDADRAFVPASVFSRSQDIAESFSV